MTGRCDTAAELASLAAWIEEQLGDETADRQWIAESAAARVRDITGAAPDTCPDCGVLPGGLHTLNCGARDSGQEIWPGMRSLAALGAADRNGRKAAVVAGPFETERQA